MKVEINGTKILLYVGGIIVSLAITISTWFINDIHTSIISIEADIKVMMHTQYKAGLDRNKASYVDQALLDKVKVAQDDIKELQERLP